MLRKGKEGRLGITIHKTDILLTLKFSLELKKAGGIYTHIYIHI